MAVAPQEKLVAEDVAVEYFDRVNKHQTVALDKVDLSVRAGEFFCIVGPSGCGKTTFINVVDGLIPLTRGRILLDGRPVGAPGPDRAMVFQSPMLLPWRNVLDNVTYGVECGGVGRAEALDRARRFVDLVGLTGFERHYPHQLSGGMQQRANLARALAVDPEILLMDEPFAALDAQTRELMQGELLRIWQQAKKTVIFITHQVSEAVFLADRVAIMSSRPGRVIEVVEIDLPRPRDSETKRDPRAVALQDHIETVIKPEARRAMGQERASLTTSEGQIE